MDLYGEDAGIVFCRVVKMKKRMRYMNRITGVCGWEERLFTGEEIIDIVSKHMARFPFDRVWVDDVDVSVEWK